MYHLESGLFLVQCPCCQAWVSGSRKNHEPDQQLYHSIQYSLIIFHLVPWKFATRTATSDRCAGQAAAVTSYLLWQRCRSFPAIDQPKWTFLRVQSAGYQFYHVLSMAMTQEPIHWRYLPYPTIYKAYVRAMYLHLILEFGGTQVTKATSAMTCGVNKNTAREPPVKQIWTEMVKFLAVPSYINIPINITHWGIPYQCCPSVWSILV